MLKLSTRVNCCNQINHVGVPRDCGQFKVGIVVRWNFKFELTLPRRLWLPISLFLDVKSTRCNYCDMRGFDEHTNHDRVLSHGGRDSVEE